MHELYVKNFSEFPGPRFKKLGSGSGEEFRDEILIPAITQHGEVRVILDGTYGYGSSFLEEAFGGLARKNVATESIIFIRDNLISKDDSSLITEIRGYINSSLSSENESK